MREGVRSGRVPLRPRRRGFLCALLACLTRLSRR